MLRLFVDSPAPGDQVHGHQVHAAKVRSAPASVNLDTGAQDHCHHLEHCHCQAQQSRQLHSIWRAVGFVNVLDEAEDEVGEGADAKDQSTNPDKG